MIILGIAAVAGVVAYVSYRVGAFPVATVATIICGAFALDFVFGLGS